MSKFDAEMLHWWSEYAYHGDGRGNFWPFNGGMWDDPIQHTHIGAYGDFSQEHENDFGFSDEGIRQGDEGRESDGMVVGMQEGDEHVEGEVVGGVGGEERVWDSSVLLQGEGEVGVGAGYEEEEEGEGEDGEEVWSHPGLLQGEGEGGVGAGYEEEEEGEVEGEGGGGGVVDRWPAEEYGSGYESEYGHVSDEDEAESFWALIGMIYIA